MSAPQALGLDALVTAPAPDPPHHPSVFDRLERLRRDACDGELVGRSLDGLAVFGWLRTTPRTDPVWSIVEQSYLDSLRASVELAR